MWRNVLIWENPKRIDTILRFEVTSINPISKVIKQNKTQEKTLMETPKIPLETATAV